MAPISHYLVYRCSATRQSSGEPISYHGITGVLAGQTDHQALLLRREWHESRPVFVLRNSVDLRMSVLQTGLAKADALIEECRVTASAYIDDADSGATIRGGPWCRLSLTATEKKCLQLVYDATSRAEVKRIAGQAPGSDLSKHLRGERYSSGHGSLDNVSMFPLARPPCAISSKERSSGRSNWEQWRGDARPYSERWPSNFDGFPEWKRRKAC